MVSDHGLNLGLDHGVGVDPEIVSTVIYYCCAPCADTMFLGIAAFCLSKKKEGSAA